MRWLLFSLSVVATLDPVAAAGSAVRPIGAPNPNFCAINSGEMLKAPKRQPELARRRADAIRRYIVEHGIKDERVIIQGEGLERLRAVMERTGDRHWHRFDVDWCAD